MIRIYITSTEATRATACDCAIQTPDHLITILTSWVNDPAFSWQSNYWRYSTPAVWNKDEKGYNRVEEDDQYVDVTDKINVPDLLASASVCPDAIRDGDNAIIEEYDCETKEEITRPPSKEEMPIYNLLVATQKLYGEAWGWEDED